MAAHPSPIIRRREPDLLLERLREVEHVAEAERIGDLLERALAVINRRARPFEAAAFLIAARRFTGELHETLPEVLVVESDLPGHVLRRQPAGRPAISKQAQA